jgi:two-component system CheB/CheR fusion protein
VEEALSKAIAANGDYEATFRVRREDGEPRWVKGFGRVVAGSTPPRLVGVSIDVTPEYTLAETRELMLREMNHRVKNLFAVIAGMIAMAARSHAEVARFADDLRARIAALGRAHSLASPAGQPQAVGLEEIVAATLAPYRDHARLTIEGEPVALDRACLSPLALVLHEWATNSVKYGALGGDGQASLAVTWAIRDGALLLTWNEEGARRLEQVEGARGFGSVLVETSVRQLRGEVTKHVADRHFRIEAKLPAGVLARD